MGLKGGITVFLLALALAPAAQAAERYAAPPPTGVGTSCSKELPCSLQYAIENAKTNDEVIVAAGDYPVPTPIKVGAKGVYVHGVFAGPMPRIQATVFAAPIRFYEAGGGGHVAHLEVVNDAAGAWGFDCLVGGGTIERVRASVTGDFAIALRAGPNCSVRDSLFRADGKTAYGLIAEGSSGDTTMTARNLTLIATGPSSYGVSSFYNVPPGGASGSFRVNLRNSIASGEQGDLRAGGSTGLGAITVGDSNFDTILVQPFGSIVDAGGNQSAPPLFVNAAAGNFREAAGSPTIDAGVADQIGPLDLDGNPRVLGPAPDIGAYEFIPQPASNPTVAGSSPGEIELLALLPNRFRPANVGGAILSARRAPVGSTVSYALSAVAMVQFSVERKLVGRRVGKKCVKKTKANATRKKCPLFKPVKGGFTHSGATGQNRFTFTGRLQKALAPGSYRLTGKTSASSRSATFKIVR